MKTRKLVTHRMKRLAIVLVITILMTNVPMTAELATNVCGLAVSEIGTQTVYAASRKFDYTKDVPAYSGNAVVKVNKNKPFFTAKEKANTKAFESYHKLDSLGRCGVAYANLCRELMPTEERGEIGMVKPTGWHTIKYDCVDGRYLYNRCHLIAYSLAGENANKKNLITGTRSFNVDSMEKYELKTLNYLKKHSQNHVLYRVTPVFENDNLLATGVLMEAYSVEDQGKGISFCVFCYNVQNGIQIDYATGDSWEGAKKTASSGSKLVKYAGDTKTSQTQTNKTQSSKTEQTQSKEQKTDKKETTYILNTNTKKYHWPSCSSVEQIKPSNKKTYTGTAEELQRQGYTACKRCNPT